MSYCFHAEEDSRSLLVLAVAMALYLSKDSDSEEMGRMAAFFTVLGDILALFALQPQLTQCTYNLSPKASAPSSSTGFTAQSSQNTSESPLCAPLSADTPLPTEGAAFPCSVPYE